MKKIEASIKPFELEDVKRALDEIGVKEMSVSEVRAYGGHNAHGGIYRGTKFQVGFLPEVKIELILPDSRMDAAVAAIVKGTKATPIGEGKVFVSQIEDAMRGQTPRMVEQAA